MLHNASIRPSAIAGTWYPGDEQNLRAHLDDYFLIAVQHENEGELLALVAPHAGYLYSGRCAAHAFKQVLGKQYDRVIITSPMHAPAYEPYLVSAYDQYQTPLGEIPIDKAGIQSLNDTLAALNAPQITSIRREQEHSLEIELPFLQFALSRPFQLIPVMIRTHDIHSLKQLGQAFARLCQEKKTLLVASTDLSHFYPAPTAQEMDNKVLQHIRALEPAALLTENDAGTAQACGAGAVAAVLWAAMQMGANHSLILKYTHSGEVTGDNHSVVGYGAAAIYHKTDE